MSSPTGERRMVEMAPIERPLGQVHVLGAGPVGLFLTALLQSIDGPRVRLYERQSRVRRGPGWCHSPTTSSPTRSRATRRTRSTGSSVEAIFDATELETRLAYRRTIAEDLRALLHAWTRGFVPLNTIERSLSEMIDAPRHRDGRADPWRDRRRAGARDAGARRHPRRLLRLAVGDARSPAPRR